MGSNDNHFNSGRKSNDEQVYGNSIHLERAVKHLSDYIENNL